MTYIYTKNENGTLNQSLQDLQDFEIDLLHPNEVQRLLGWECDYVIWFGPIGVGVMIN